MKENNQIGQSFHGQEVESRLSIPKYDDEGKFRITLAFI